MGLRPKPRGGVAARVLLGDPPQTPDGALPQTPLGLRPKPCSEGGLGAGAPSGVWGGAPARVGADPQQHSCGEAAPGFEAEPQPPRLPPSWLRHSLVATNTSNPVGLFKFDGSHSFLKSIVEIHNESWVIGADLSSERAVPLRPAAFHFQHGAEYDLKCTSLGGTDHTRIIRKQ